ncbi:MAG: G5 domain-containing protein [Clostridia bacterium]|nr:G5 domain-containing protein [Clostridia bacterium]
MLEKVLGCLKALTSKKVLRSIFIIVAALSVAAGYVVIGTPDMVYSQSVHSVNTALGETDTVIDSTGISSTFEDAADVENVQIPEISEDVEVEEESYSPVSYVLGENKNTLEPIIFTTSYETVTETVKFGYKEVKSDKLEKGKTTVKKGSNGEKEVVYCVVSVNGIVVSREVNSERVTKEPVSQVTTIGTKLNSEKAVTTSDEVKCISTLKPDKPIELDKNGVPVNYKKVLTGKSSAYCGKCDSNSTAIGLPAQPGLVAVNFNKIPKYTKMYIVANDGTVYGYAMAADTGGFAYNGSNRIVDLRMPTGNKCNCGSNWGLKNVKIYILE